MATIERVTKHEDGRYEGDLHTVVMRWTWKVVTVLGLITGILSLLSVLLRFWNFGPIEPFRLMLEFYQQFLNAILGWADAPLQALIQRLQEWTNVRWSLAPGWKHVFVLMYLYFSADAKTNWPDHKSFAIFSMVLGGLTALASSVALGVEALGAAGSNLLPAALPMAAMVVYELVRAVWNATFSDRAFNPHSRNPFDPSKKTWGEVFVYCLFNYVLPIFMIGALVMGIGWAVGRGGFISSENDMTMLTLSCFVVVLTFYWLARGAYRASYHRRENESWMHRFMRSNAAYLGLLLLTTMLGVVLFVALNAGLKLVGL